MTIARADIQNIYPLTPLQEGMYAHAESAPDSDAYFEQWRLRIHGTLRPAFVERAWNTLFERHDIFRTVFTPGDGKRPLQIVLRHRQVEFVTKDFSAVAPSDLETRLSEERARDRARGFRLEADPLVRVQAIRLAPLDWEVLWSHHHIILDGWSAALVQSEFMRLYAAMATGTDAALDPAPPFSQFVKSLPAAADTDFWRKYLAGIDAAAELPRTEDSRPPALARQLVELSPGISARIDAFCRAEGVTLAAFVQAVWGVLLARYANADDVVFGYIMSGRSAELRGVERMVGMLINTLPVRIQLGADETFRSLVARVHRQAADLVAHQHTPLVEIQRACGAGARVTHVVAIENYPEEERLGGAETGFEVTSATSYDRTQYGFDLVVLPGHDALRFRLSWDQAIHDDDLMVRMGGQLAHVINSVLAQPDAKPCHLNILPPDQWDAAVRLPNRTSAGYPATQTIVDLFDEQAAARPNAPALLAPHESGEWLTYGELQARATAVAAHLQHDLKIPVGSRVAVFAGPSTGAIISMLGILKAGSAYVPIDPRYPTERVRFLLEDSHAAAILRAGSDDLPLHAAAVPIVDVVSLPAADARPLVARAAPDDRAYVIYTSGSTGTPKGCEITHRNVVRLIVNDRLDFDFGSADVWVLAHSLSFDFSVWEVFGALLHGARLIVPTRDTVQDVPAFRALLSSGRVTVLNQTPLAFANLIAVEESADAHALGDHLRYVIFGGDRLDAGALRPWIRHYPLSTVALINMYGITETTVHVTFCRLTEDQIRHPRRLSPVGRPLPETSVYVCDRHGNPQPIGAPGEMLVGGTGVCRDYLDRPELTAERFIPDVFAGSGRLYRSGDLAVRDRAGALNFIGRNDAQVKIRGHRIEPAEIVHALRAVEGVDQAAVFVETGPTGPELVACVSGRADAGALRAAVSERLPAYAVPSQFVVCNVLPLTANGKLDREAVRRLRDQAAGVAAPTFEAPATERERILADVWAAVLATPRVGRHDRFINLGGDSIKSIQILARLRARGLTLDLKDLFRYPTVAELAPKLTERRAVAAAADATSPFALTPIQQRFFETHPVDRAHFNHALLLRVERAVDPERLRAALQALYDAHGTLRLRFHQQPDGTWLQQVSPRGEPVRLSVVDVSAEPDDVGAVFAHSALEQTGLDLGEGPVFRAALYRRPGADRLLLVAHHLAVDGVSWQILLDDLSAALTGAAPLATTDAFSHWAAMVRAPELHRALVAELPAWQRMDAATDDDSQALLGDAGVYADARESLIEWNTDDTSDLLRRAPAAYHTNAGELLLAAAARALGRWTGRRQLQIALESHGRDAVPGADVSRTVGWFTSLYPFVLNLDNGEVGRRIRQLKEDLRRIPGGGAGYGILRYLSAIPGARALSAHPRVSFNYLGELNVRASDTWVSPSRDPIGPSASPRGPRPFALELAAMAIDGRLRLAITYPGAVMSEASIQELRRALEEELRVVVDHCTGRKEPELTPADLTHKGLSLDEFEGLFDEN
jgi:amino acid adenylation domain-containing protein/non-ribosomal peptide synthase protein (TIGR01720 family)